MRRRGDDGGEEQRRGSGRRGAEPPDLARVEGAGACAAGDEERRGSDPARVAGVVSIRAALASGAMSSGGGAFPSIRSGSGRGGESDWGEGASG